MIAKGPSRHRRETSSVFIEARPSETPRPTEARPPTDGWQIVVHCAACGRRSLVPDEVKPLRCPHCGSLRRRGR